MSDGKFRSASGISLTLGLSLPQLKSRGSKFPGFCSCSPEQSEDSDPWVGACALPSTFENPIQKLPSGATLSFIKH